MEVISINVYIKFTIFKVYSFMKKVLVIGSNSFSGSSFIDFILDKKYQVIGVSRL